MKLEYDPDKRTRTIEVRGLDFDDARQVLSGTTLRKIDKRKDYGEVRYISIGQLDERIVVVVWTTRGDAVRVISMRLADGQERKHYRRELDRPG